MKMKPFFVVMMLGLLFLATSSFSQAPILINYQGKLIIDNIAPTAPFDLTFYLYKVSNGGLHFWNETHRGVMIKNGVFNVILGSDQSQNRVLRSLLTENNDLYLEIKVEPNLVLPPRTRLTSVAFAIRSTYSDTAQYAKTADPWIRRGNDVYYDNTQGRVGIGASSFRTVGTKLHLAGGNDHIIIEETGAEIRQNEKFWIIKGEDGDLEFIAVEDFVPPGIYLPALVCSRVGRGNDSLYVGIGTSDPTAKLHVFGIPGVDGIRFPDGTLQTTAATGGQVNRNSLDAEDGDPRNRVFVDKNGKVGIGTTNPTQELEVAGEIKLNSGEEDGARLIWKGGIGNSKEYLAKVGPDGEFKFFPVEGDTSFTMLLTQDRKVGIGILNPQERLHVDGNIKATGQVCATNVTCSSSREVKENVVDLTAQEAFKTLYGLSPTKFNYRAENDKDLHIGFIAEDVPDLVATPDRKGVSPMDIVAVLTKVVQEQQKTIQALENRVTALEEQIKNGKRP